VSLGGRQRRVEVNPGRHRRGRGHHGPARAELQAIGDDVDPAVVLPDGANRAGQPHPAVERRRHPRGQLRAPPVDQVCFGLLGVRVVLAEGEHPVLSLSEPGAARGDDRAVGHLAVPHAPPDAIARLEHDHVAPGRGEPPGGRQARETGSDDADFGLIGRHCLIPR
jgi:hypothetical protein